MKRGSRVDDPGVGDLRVLSMERNATGDWVVTFDGPHMQRLQATVSGYGNDPDVIAAIGRHLALRARKIPEDRIT